MSDSAKEKAIINAFEEAVAACLAHRGDSVKPFYENTPLEFAKHVEPWLVPVFVGVPLETLAMCICMVNFKQYKGLKLGDKAIWNFDPNDPAWNGPVKSEVEVDTEVVVIAALRDDLVGYLVPYYQGFQQLAPVPFEQQLAEHEANPPEEDDPDWLPQDMLVGHYHIPEFVSKTIVPKVENLTSGTTTLEFKAKDIKMTGDVDVKGSLTVDGKVFGQEPIWGIAKILPEQLDMEMIAKHPVLKAELLKLIEAVVAEKLYALKDDWLQPVLPPKPTTATEIQLKQEETAKKLHSKFISDLQNAYAQVLAEEHAEPVKKGYGLTGLSKSSK